MARKKSAVKTQANNIVKKSNRIINKALNKLQASSEMIANEGLQMAQATLVAAASSHDFTQKHGEMLMNEIGIQKISKNGYKVYAPVSGDNEIIKYEMYFAEYGAGLGASEAKSTPTGVAAYNYIPQFVIQEGEHAGYWFYPLLEPRPYVNKEGELKISSKGFTNTSVAANYMWAARQAMKTTLNQKIAETEKEIGKGFKKPSFKFKTNITRPKSNKWEG